MQKRTVAQSCFGNSFSSQKVYCACVLWGDQTGRLVNMCMRRLEALHNSIFPVEFIGMCPTVEQDCTCSHHTAHKPTILSPFPSDHTNTCARSLWTPSPTHACTCMQPIISLCRCKPDAKYRWIFNWIHGKIIGRLVMIFACEYAQGESGTIMEAHLFK